VTAPAAAHGFVVRCAATGELLEVLADPERRWAGGPGTRLQDVLGAGSHAKAQRLLDAVQDDGHAFAWELVLDDATTVHVSAVVEGDHLLVFTAPLDEGVLGVLAGLTGINNAVVNRLRALEGQQARRLDAPTVSSLDRELVQLHRELARRTAELEAANEQKDQLIGMAAHDLRNPLGAIRGFAQLLLTRAADRLDERELLVLRRIERSSDRMLDLVGDLLELADLGRDDLRLMLRRERCDVAGLVRDAIEVDRAVAEDKQVTIDLDVPDGPMVATVDPHRLEQVLSNLVTNAVKFSDRGATIAVRLREEASGLVLEVSDHGPGIPEDERELVFQPFARTSVKPTEDEPSTGLGLTIVRRIVQAHGGRVELDSEVGVGSTFRVRLPRRLPPAQPSAASIPARSQDTTARTPS
jgi:two-component system OmpR family sensor kinase